MNHTKDSPFLEGEQLFDLRWPVVDVVIGGKSAIDLAGLGITDWDQASSFLRSYGFDPDDRWDRRRLHALLIESTHTIAKHLLTQREVDKGLAPPDKITACTDIRHLILWASQKDDPWTQAWSCAILRVAHTIAHIDGVTRHHNVEAARQEIFQQFQNHLFRNEKGQLRLGTQDLNLGIEKVDWKYDKSRESVILKLLHKKGNVAETIYDLVGLRIVTSDIPSVLLTVGLLVELNIITFANCVPDRSRNNLLDIPSIKERLEALRSQIEGRSFTLAEFIELTHEVATPQARAKVNSHSSAAYRSVQLTCRQVIRSPNPELSWLQKVKSAAADTGLSPQYRQTMAEFGRFVEGWHSVRAARSMQGFFPYEVQVLDQAAYKAATKGMAAHAAYKKSQIRAARKRVLGRVLELSKRPVGSDT